MLLEKRPEEPIQGSRYMLFVDVMEGGRNNLIEGCGVR